jgi:transposase
MQAITTIGLDIAKSVSQVHGVDAAGQVVVRRQLKRRYVLAFIQKLPPCLVGIEACASFKAFRNGECHGVAPGHIASHCDIITSLKP